MSSVKLQQYTPQNSPVNAGVSLATASDLHHAFAHRSKEHCVTMVISEAFLGR